VGLTFNFQLSTSNPRRSTLQNDRSTPKFDHSLEFTILSRQRSATMSHVYPEPRRVSLVKHPMLLPITRSMSPFLALPSAVG